MLRCLAQLFVLLNIKSSCFDADPEAVISEAEDSLLKLRGEVAGSEPIRPVGCLLYTSRCV